MDNLKLFSQTDVKTLVNKRAGESKFGEHVKLISNFNTIYEALQNLDVDYVIFGVCEDVGIFANHGNTGARSAWKIAIKVLLNIQSNQFTKANRVCILGHLEYEHLLSEIDKLNPSKKKDVISARKFVDVIDKDVSYLVSQIVKAGKKPIIIGGGHNNAYGNIKGTSLGLSKPINAINFDAHTDFRKEEGRHSGNGFSYAFAEGFLKNYFIFGLHENYTSQSVFDKMNKLKEVKYNTYEAIEVRKETSFKTELKKASLHVVDQPFGIEIDCDAIVNVPSSAKTPSGFSVSKTRQFLSYFSKFETAAYLHLCEAAPKKKDASKVGKLLTYLITDYIKS